MGFLPKPNRKLTQSLFLLSSSAWADGASCGLFLTSVCISSSVCALALPSCLVCPIPLLWLFSSCPFGQVFLTLVSYNSTGPSSLSLYSILLLSSQSKLTLPSPVAPRDVAVGTPDCLIWEPLSV